MFVALYELFREKAGCVGVANSEFAEGVVTKLDASGCKMRDVTGREYAVQFPFERINDATIGTVRFCDAFLLQVETIGRSVVRCSLEVDTAVVDETLGAGKIIKGEHHVIALLISYFDRLVVLPHKKPMSVIRDDDDSMTGELWPHQNEALHWMRNLELMTTLSPLRFEHNLRITGTWFIDPDDECFTKNPGFREARVRGGILGDFAGAGKTRVALHHCMSASLPSKTLIIVPLNIIEQWVSELGLIENCSTISMVATRDARSRIMEELNSADVVLTTFQFLRGSKAYASAVEDAVHAATHMEQKHCRSPAAYAAYARVAPPNSPGVIEAISWNRIIVDEIHEAFLDVRNVRLLHSLRTQFAWGISATPELWTGDAQNFYWLLRREKQHHPNLLHQLLQECVRLTRSADASSPMLTAVDPMHDERERVMHAQFTQTMSGVIQSCTSAVITDHVDATSPEEITAEQRARVQVLLAETYIDLPDHEAITMEVEKCRNHLCRLEETVELVLRGEETCCICESSSQTTVLECAHAFCRRCIDRHRSVNNESCPMCRTPFSTSRGVAIPGAKLSHIADLCQRTDCPVLVFVQWKQVQRALKSILHGRAVNVFTLEGNGSQRRKALADFHQTQLGVLILTIDESNGLHLPHARHVIFSHAFVADREHVQQMEYQAIARCTRAGQRWPVRVESFVLSGFEEDYWASTRDR